MEAWRLLFPTRWLIRSGFLFTACVSAHAQVTAAAGIAPGHVQEKLQTVPRVPGLSTFFDGLNAGVTYSAIHSSSVGWYSAATPAISYSFSRRYSADASTSIYFHRLADSKADAPSHPPVNGRVDPGDTLIGFHAFFEPGSLQDTITAALTAPTGNQAKGFGAGQVTYDFSNHLERYFDQLGVILDLGAGNSSGLFNDLVAKDYSSVGGLAHFESGLVYWFPHRSYLQAVAYEQLPLGSQTVYRTVPRGGAIRANGDDAGDENLPPPTVSTMAEDNGFTTIAGLPLTRHVTLSGYYNRSLRQNLDTVSFGFTYVLRGKPSDRLSMIDRALREAEGGAQQKF
jgi:hypothetical protein